MGLRIRYGKFITLKPSDVDAEMLSRDSEIASFKRAFRKAIEESETLSNLLVKMQNESESLKRQIANVADDREQLQESYTLYVKSLNQTETELFRTAIVNFF